MQAVAMRNAGSRNAQRRQSQCVMQSAHAIEILRSKIFRSFGENFLKNTESKIRNIFHRFGDESLVIFPVDGMVGQVLSSQVSTATDEPQIQSTQKGSKS